MTTDRTPRYVPDALITAQGTPGTYPVDDASRVAYLSTLTLEGAEDAYRNGRLSEDEYTGYRHAWRNGAARFTELCLAEAQLPDGKAREIGRAILATLGHANVLPVA